MKLRLLVLGVVLAAVGVGIAFWASDDDQDDIDVSTTAPDDPDPVDAAPEPDNDRPAAAATMLDVAPTAAGIDAAAQAWPWIVPWGDGFLQLQVAYDEPQLPQGIPDELRELFPPEVQALFGEGEEISLEDAQLRVEEAGFTDVVEEIFEDNPELFESLFGGQPSGTLSGATSADGVTWEPVDITMPEAAGLDYVASDGTNLAVSVTDWSSPQPTTTIFTTSDLLTWTETPLPSPDRPDYPEYVHVSTNVQALAAGPQGWVAVQVTHTHLDPYELVVDDLDELDHEDGFGMSTDPSGVTITFGDSYGYPMDAESEDSSADAPEAIRYTWEELGVDQDLVDEFMQGPPTDQTTVWSAPWGGSPASWPAPDGWIAGVVATGDGFIMSSQGEFGLSTLLTSADGTAWTPMATAPPVNVEGLAATVDGIIVAQGYTDTGTSGLYVSRDAGVSWESLTLPDLPTAEGLSSGGGPGASGPGIAMALQHHDSGPQPDIGEVTYSHDGFDITEEHLDRSHRVTIVDATSGEVVLDEEHRYPTQEEYRAADEAGTLDETFGQPTWMSYAEEGHEVRFSDPTTGEVILTVPHDVQNRAFDAAYQQAMEELGGPIEPEFRVFVLATVDGVSWLLDEIETDGDFYGPTAAAVNGDRLVVHTGMEILSYDLS